MHFDGVAQRWFVLYEYKCVCGIYHARASNKQAHLLMFFLHVATSHQAAAAAAALQQPETASPGKVKLIRTKFNHSFRVLML